MTNSTADIFGVDSTISSYNYNVPDLLDSLSDDLVNVNTWCSKNRMALNISKSKFILMPIYTILGYTYCCYFIRTITRCNC